MATPVNDDARSGETSRDLGENVALEEENRKNFKRKVRKLKKLPQETNPRIKSSKGIMYIAHLPHGFYEDQLKGFFTQFGTITKLRLPRSKTTGNVKGYGWIEFEHEEVAKIAASTMNNYLMFNKLLKCKFMPREECPPHLFKGWRKKVEAGKWQRINAYQMNKKKGAGFDRNARKAYKKSYKKMMNSLSSFGISYSLKEENLTLGAKSAEQSAVLKQDILAPSEDIQPSPEPTSRVKNSAPKPSTLSAKKQTTDTLNVLMVDSDDDEVTFKTPPNTMKMSRRSGFQLQPSKFPGPKQKAVEQVTRAKSATKEQKRKSVALMPPRLVVTPADQPHRVSL